MMIWTDEPVLLQTRPLAEWTDSIPGFLVWSYWTWSKKIVRDTKRDIKKWRAVR